jgi:hypothetical protein
MLARLRAHFGQQPVAYLALFIALGGTGAYAANTIGSADVINDSLLSEDVKNATLTSGDLREGTIGSGRIADGSITGTDVRNDSLAGADIQESTLTTVPSSSSGRVVMRARGGSRTASNTPTPYPLTQGTWSQVPGESGVIFGEASVTAPAECGPPPGPGGTPGLPSLSLVLRLDGSVIQIIGASGPTTPHFVFERPTGGTRTLTAEFNDNCTGGHFVVNSLAVNAYGMR